VLVRGYPRTVPAVLNDSGNRLNDSGKSPGTGQRERKVVEPIAAEDLPKWVFGTLLRRSDDLGWKGVKLRTWGYQGQDVEVPPLRDFMLVAYQVGTTPMERRFDGRWSRTTCGRGACSLLTRSQKSHWHWTEDVDVTHVYLAQDFVSDVAAEVSGRTIADVTLADVLRADDPQMVHAIAEISAEVDQGGLGGPLYIDAVARQLVILLLRRYAALTFRLREQEGMLTAA
jgi:AraC family transcriptional regulator